MTREELLARLEDEVAAGWPEPLDGSREPWDKVSPELVAYIDLVATVLIEGTAA